MPTKPPAQSWWRRLGPGLITGASDDDPSGIVTYSQTGAQFGFRLLWLAPFTVPLMYAVQEMAARLGILQRRGLTSVIRKFISPRSAAILGFGLLVVNTVNIGADLNAMAAVSRLLLPISSVWYLMTFAVLIICLETFISYRRYVKVLKWLTLALFTYVIAALVISPNWSIILGDAFWPRLIHDPAVWLMITAILGTTISPYLMYWQESEEVEEETSQPLAPDELRRQLRTMRVDTAIGMLFSNLIMFFIIVVTAATLHQAGITNITTAAEAASALQPVGGQLTFLLFAMGVIGTGLLAIPVLAGSAAYAVSEIFHWSEGLSKTFRQARGFYSIIALAVIFGVLTTISGVSAIPLLISAAVFNGLLAPVVVWYLLRLADNPAVVGQHRSPTSVRWLGWLTWVIMTAVSLITISQFISRS